MGYLRSNGYLSTLDWSPTRENNSFSPLLFTTEIATTTLTQVCIGIQKIGSEMLQAVIRIVATIAFGYRSLALVDTTPRTGLPRWYRSNYRLLWSTLRATRPFNVDLLFYCVTSCSDGVPVETLIKDRSGTTVWWITVGKPLKTQLNF